MPPRAWTADENKQFERALAGLDLGSPSPDWERVARATGKTVPEVMTHFKDLEVDVLHVESGMVPFPFYGAGGGGGAAAAAFTLQWDSGSGGGHGGVAGDFRHGYRFGGGCGRKRHGGRTPEQERKKRVPWTKEEHKKSIEMRNSSAVARPSMPSGDESSVPRLSILSDNGSVVPPRRMPFHLLEEITDHFSEDRKLGAGAYGTVYLGEHRNGENIAVKVLHGHLQIDHTQFEEYLDLASIQHKNIVQLVGYCHETTREYVMYNGRMVFAEKMKTALCSQYMPNGSLYNCLSDESNGHDWRTRYAIIKGICDGLKYLHEELESPMYHFDLKPQNILLDERLVPKIKDFGSSSFLRYEQETRYNTWSSVGTPGYVPPECIENGIISPKSGIFSLGVTIINIMAGRDGYFRSGEMSSSEFIENVHGNWSNRLQETSTDELESYCKQVKTCIEIALRCVEADWHKRPTIGIIVNELNQTETISQHVDGLRGFCNASSSVASAMPRSGVAIGSRAHTRGALTSRSPTVLVPPPPLAGQFSDPAQPLLPAPQMRSEHHYMSLQHLKEITKDFSEEQILGIGGSSVVYKGELQNGEMIAVKKVEQKWSSEEKCKEAKKQFKNEVKLLMEIKHPNIVKLLGHCYETHSAPFLHDGTSIFLWQIDCLLCLEFLPESLDNHISDATSGLDWHTRYKIIEGSCNGLQYLHEQSHDPIIHLDLKPGNILLDKNKVPKIADFGISRVFKQRQTIHTKIMSGTLGYMPPEYLRGIITPMTDIFSLGVIIMEVITGHRDYPDDLQSSSEEFINTELQKWRDTMEQEAGNTNQEIDCQQIKKCIQIGLMCVNPDRRKRPPIRNIINMLQGLESPTCYRSN